MCSEHCAMWSAKCAMCLCTHHQSGAAPISVLHHGAPSFNHPPLQVEGSNPVGETTICAFSSKSASERSLGKHQTTENVSMGNVQAKNVKYLQKFINMFTKVNHISKGLYQQAKF